MTPYQYAYNNPLRYVDPSGKNVLNDLGIIAGKLFSQYLNANCLSMADVGRALLAGTAAIVVGIAVGWVIASAGVLILGSGLLAAVVSDAVAGLVAGQFSQGVSNAILGKHWYEGLFKPKDLLVDTAFGGLGGAAGYGLEKLAKSLLVTNALKSPVDSADDAISKADDFFKVIIKYEDDLPFAEFNRKVKSLLELSDDGVLFKAKNPVSRNQQLTRSYKKRLLRIYGINFMKKILVLQRP